MAKTREEIEAAVAAAKARAQANSARVRTNRGQAEPAAPITLGGLGKATASGVRSGAEGLVGLPGDIPDMTGSGIGWIAKRLGVDEATALKIAQSVTNAARSSMDPRAALEGALRMTGVSQDTGPLPNMFPTSGDVGGVTDKGVNLLPESVSGPLQDITRHQPQNAIEELGYTTGAFASGAALPGSAAARVARVAIPSMATEAAGQATRALAPEWEEAARLVAGLVSGGATAMGERSFRTRRALARIDSNPAAMNRAKQLLAESGMTPEDVETSMRELGVGSMPADVNDLMLQQTQKLQNAGGEARGVIAPKLKEREAGKNTRLLADTEAAVGAERQPGLIEQALLERKQAGAAAQRESHASQAAPADLEPIVADIDAMLAGEKSPKIRKTLESVRRMLHESDAPGIGHNQGPPLETGSAPVLSARQAIREMLYQKDGTPQPGLGAKEGQILDDIYARLNEQLDTANPTLRQADADIAQASKEGEAFTKGREIYENPRGADTSVEFKQNFDALSEGEKARLAEGLNAETYRKLGISGNNLVELEKLIRGEGKWNYEKVSAVIGEDKTRQLMDAIKREKVFHNTHQKVIEGSKTAGTLPGDAAKGDGFLKQAGKAGVDAAASMVLDPSGGVAGGIGISRLKDYLADLRRKGGGGKSDEGLARLLTSTDPEQLKKGVQIIRQRGLLLPDAILAALQSRQRELGGGQ